MNIDIGCGQLKQAGFIGIDRTPQEGVDIVCDLNDGIPLEDDTVDLVLASHILEHLGDTVKIMHEIWRVCKHGAQVAIAVPHFQSLGAWSDPTHLRPFTEATFCYFDPSHPLYSIYKFKARFKIRNIQWTTLGNIEAILIAVKDGDYQDNQETALQGEGLDKAIRNKPKAKREKAQPKKSNRGTHTTGRRVCAGLPPMARKDQADYRHPRH